MKLGLIGTAGRGDDKVKLTHEIWDKMVQAVTKILVHEHWETGDLQVVSGGAAWADHLAVTMVLLGIIHPEQLTLYLPAVLTENGYTGDNDWTSKVAKTANYYHQEFGRVTGYKSIVELNHVIKSGANVEVITSGFKPRNTKVANFLEEDGHMIAFTFGNDQTDQVGWTYRSFEKRTPPDIAGLKDGGTADTWSKAKCWLHHVRLGSVLKVD